MSGKIDHNKYGILGGIIMNWLISANSNIYDHYNSFKDYGYIDWRQNNNFEVNDIVYIYVAKPFSRIMYKCVVTKTNMRFDK